MSGSPGKKYPVQHKFPGPTELKVPLAEDFGQEYFKKIASRKGRRLSCYPAVEISDGRIVKTYGTEIPADVTDLFYAGVETVYCISPAPPSKSNSSTNKLPRGHIKKGPERKPRTIDGNNADLDAILGFTNIERQEEEHLKQRRQSASTLKDRQLGQTPCRSIASAGTDLSTDKELLNDLRVSLKTKRDSYDNACVDLKNQYPAWASDRQYSATDSTSQSIKERRVSSTDDTSLYMTNISNNRRQISKGELKKKRLGKTTKVEIPTATPGEMSLSKRSAPMGMSLAISGKVPEVKQVKDVSSYQMRQKYADELERNWLENIVEKAKKKKVDGSWLKRRYDLRLDMFYSPEPDDDTDTQSDTAPEKNSLNICHRNTETNQKVYVQEEDQVFQQSFNSEINVSLKFTSRENSISTPTRNLLEKQKGTIPSLKDKRSFLRHFDSTDVLVGNVGELEESSASEIETVLHNGQLQERRCKHKMYRKRRRQKKRFEPFIKVPSMSDDSYSEEEDVKQESNVTVNKFSVAEIRSMRLKAKTKKAPNIKGLKKFRQIANVIFIFVQFRKLLHKMRHVRQKSVKRGMRKGKRGKKVKWNKDLQIYSRFERQTSPAKEPIHEKFMREIGVKLLDDMAKLPIIKTTDKPFTADEGEEQDEHIGGMSFYYEIQKVDISDISSLPQTIDIRKRERRFSEPGPSRPDHLTFKVPEKSTSKKSQRKSRKRSSSPLKSPGRKNQDSSPAALLGKAPSSLPPLLAPPSPGLSARHSPGPSHKHKHDHNASPGKQKQKCRGRSASPAKRRHSRSPAVENKSAPRRAFKEVTIWPDICRQRSLSISNVAFKREISLRELLKDVDIPAKEIFIQVVERKRKRRRRKLANAAVHQEQRDIERRIMEERAEVERERLAEQQRLEEEKKIEKDQMLRHYVSPFVSTGVAWNRKKLRPIATWTNKELDLEITKLSGLFFEMRNCSYIRWSNKDQAILRRLAELENVRV